MQAHRRAGVIFATMLAASLLPTAAATVPVDAAAPLAGIVVGIDPGHNGRNYAYPSYLRRQVWNGREWEDCDTTGTQTNGGYTESLFNFRVASYLRAALQRDGARVVMTRPDNNGHGPCVDTRAKTLNRAHANIAVDIHADGGPSSGRGFTILEPVRDKYNEHVIAASARFGSLLRSAMLRLTSMPTSTYYGSHGIAHRNDLAGLNLATQPKVLIETGNMRNSRDAALLTSARFQRQVAAAMESAIRAYLRR
jgi:N-acetylmuramoyl-L-alanine amidase